MATLNEYGGLVGTTGFEKARRIRHALKKTGGRAQRGAQPKDLPAELVTIADKWGRLPKKIRRALLSIVPTARE